MIYDLDDVGVRAESLIRFASSFNEGWLIESAFKVDPPPGTASAAWASLDQVRRIFRRRFHGHLVVFDVYADARCSPISDRDVALLAINACSSLEAAAIEAKARAIDLGFVLSRKGLAAVARRLEAILDAPPKDHSSTGVAVSIEPRALCLQSGNRRLDGGVFLSSDEIFNAELLDLLKTAKADRDAVRFFMAWGSMQLRINEIASSGATVKRAWVEEVVAGIEGVRDAMPARAGRRSPTKRLEALRLITLHYLRLTGRERPDWSNACDCGLGGPFVQFLDTLCQRHPANPPRLATRASFDRQMRRSN